MEARMSGQQRAGGLSLAPSMHSRPRSRPLLYCRSSGAYPGSRRCSQGPVPRTHLLPDHLVRQEAPRERQEVRAAEAYFVKFPVELFDVIPGLDNARLNTAVDPAEAPIP